MTTGAIDVVSPAGALPDGIIPDVRSKDLQVNLLSPTVKWTPIGGAVACHTTPTATLRG